MISTNCFKLIPRLSLVALTVLVSACSSTDEVPKMTTSGSPANPTKSIARGLVGRWHNNDFALAGATKQFTPSQSNPLAGSADGFWPGGGAYTILDVEPSRRILKLRLTSTPDEEPRKTILAEAILSTDNQHLTWKQISPVGDAKRPVLYYRVP